MANCAACGLEVQERWAECPRCEAPLVRRCPSCGLEVGADWRKCPECRAVLTSGGASPSFTGAMTGSNTASDSGSASPFLTVVGAAVAPATNSRPPVPVLSPGSLLGKYRIERVLGTGAYGTVYAAHNPDLDEVVALKAVGTFGDAEALRAAVAAEYKIQRGLPDKRHILESYPPEVVEAFGLRWVLLPMELATETLREWLTRHAGQAEQLDTGLALLRQAVAGLAVLHAAGLVHRDVKPENLLLVTDAAANDASGMVVKVADFGLASGLEKLASTRPELVGDGIGTPAYMAPEQVMAAHWKDVTPAVDAYAVGTILFELLDGERPYSGTAQQLRSKKRDRELTPRTPQGPPHLAELALTLLQFDRALRLSMADVLAHLVQVKPAEAACWENALQATSDSGLEEYLRSFPDGRYRDAALVRLQTIASERDSHEAARRQEAAEAERSAATEKAASDQLQREKAERQRAADAKASAVLREREETRKRLAVERGAKQEREREELAKSAKAEEWYQDMLKAEADREAKQAFGVAQSVDTVAAYESFLRRYPVHAAGKQALERRRDDEVRDAYLAAGATKSLKQLAAFYVKHRGTNWARIAREHYQDVRRVRTRDSFWFCCDEIQHKQRCRKCAFDIDATDSFT